MSFRKLAIWPSKSPEPTPINREQAAVGAVSLPRKRLLAKTFGVRGFAIAEDVINPACLSSGR